MSLEARTVLPADDPSLEALDQSGMQSLDFNAVTMRKG